MNKIKLPLLKKTSSALILGACITLITPALLGVSQYALGATSAAASLPDFADLVEKSGPAVVNIRTTEKAKAAAPESATQDEQMQEIFRRYFGVPGGSAPAPVPKDRRPPQAQDEQVQRGIGSGFIISQDGYVISNAHVVDNADEVYVKLTDKREFKAKVIGVDTRTDIAVLKIDGTGLPKATIGDSAKARVGEWVIAIGSPFELDNTVTAGIISAKARETGDFLPLIQTDVAVNPGNSGGPLINMRGEVVGINSQIYSRSGGYMGISFAIPIDEAISTAEQLKISGRVTRGRLGVYLGDVRKEIVESLGLASEKGGLIHRVEKDGPADKIGLQGGDIILKFNGVTVEKSADLRRLAAATKPGTKVPLSVWRNGAAHEFEVTLAEIPQEKVATDAESRDVASGKQNALGITAKTLSATERKELRINSGVVIESAEGPAAKAGLQAGDIVLTINNIDVKDATQFFALAARADGKKPVILLVRRGENSQFVSVRPAAQ
ncbi:MAG: DegQ family serine endoprotease [Pseudomonadota bacterium]